MRYPNSNLFSALLRGVCISVLFGAAYAQAYDQNPYSNNPYANNPYLNNGLNQANQYSQQNQRAQALQQKQQQQQIDKAKKLVDDAKKLADKAKTDAEKLAKDADAKAKGKDKVAKGKKHKKDMGEGAEVKSETAKIDEEELDSVEMLTGYTIPCKIHKELPEGIVVTVNEEHGRITIPRSDIRAFNYSMGTRLAAVAPDDHLGQYKVGLWAMEKGMYPKVIDLFEKIKGEEDVAATDILKQLGRAYEQRGQLDKALEEYNEYSLGHPDDKDAADVVKSLTEQVNPVDKKADATAAAAAPKVVDGLEGDGNWVAQTWNDANPGVVQHYVDKKNGNKMIFLESVGGLKDKTAFKRDGQALNLSDSKEMVFKIFNAGETPVSLAIAFVNAQNDFNESKQVRIPPKAWLDQTFKVEGKQFKSNRNDFKEYNQEIQGKRQRHSHHVPGLTASGRSSRCNSGRAVLL